MNIKSLLLGSAAALVAVSGARAADAIMAAEPEPVEYVRVCDAFGTGFFYIPGTETCLKISGYVRYDINGGDLLGLDRNGDGNGDSYATQARFTLNTDARTETELGTLRSFTETRFNYNNGLAADGLDNTGGTSTSLNFAFIELAGFRVGKTESEFTRMDFYGLGYAGGVINDTLVGYGPFDATQISYTYKSDNGIGAFIGVEDDNAGSDDGDGNYIPDVLAGLSYNNGTYGLAVVGAYDESLSEGAIKVRGDVTLGKLSAFLMGGYSTNGDETGLNGCAGNASFTSCGSNHYAVWGGDWAVWGGFTYAFTDKVATNVQLSYDDYDNFGAAANVAFTPVAGFTITAEVDYTDTGDVVLGGDNKIIDESWGGVLRFQRNF